MGLGSMNKKASLCSYTNTIDSEGFSGRTVATLANIRVFVEERHGSEKWANLAAFSEATYLFRFRKITNITVTTEHFIIYNNTTYNIISVENIKQKGMYYEVLAKKEEASNG